MKLAIEKDINNEYIKAVKLYEYYIKSDYATLDAYTNLAFLYWEFATEQISFNEPYDISDDWSLIGGERYGEIIKQGLNKYPDSLELKFWTKYFPYRLLGDKFTQLECEQLVLKHQEDNSLVPFFYLYLFDQMKYKAERNKLLEVCKKVPIAKHNYIRSIIE